MFWLNLNNLSSYGHRMETSPSGSYPRLWDAAAPVPAPRGHYSHAAQVGDVTWISGVLGNERPGMSALQQTVAALERLQSILAEGELTLGNVVSTTAFVTSPELWAEVNEGYGAVFGPHRPARAIIPGAVFAGDALIEIQAVAASGR